MAGSCSEAAAAPLRTDNDGPVTTDKAGQSFSEPPGDRQGVCANASKTKPAWPKALCAVAFLSLTDVANALEGNLRIDANSFGCITKMTPVRQLYVDNLQGNLDATLAAANSATGAVYPPGSVLQLVPGEAMVKRHKGFNAETLDWEFFVLDVSNDGTKIRSRGAADVVNRSGTCLGCHRSAAPQWDLVCETNHGCAPLPITPAMIRALQRTDPRCKNPSISPEDAEALRQLQEVLK
jgi:hypothetical protein